MKIEKLQKSDDGKHLVIWMDAMVITKRTDCHDEAHDPMNTDERLIVALAERVMELEAVLGNLGLAAKEPEPCPDCGKYVGLGYCRICGSLLGGKQ